MNTGDLLICDNRAKGPVGILDWLIRFFTKSVYVHVGMVIVDPTFIKPDLIGVYVWESSWEGTPDPQDGKIKLGVQLTPIDHFLKSAGKVWSRRLYTPKPLLTPEKLLEIHETVYNKPYDIVPSDWIEAIVQKDPDPQKTGRFWCSALVGYIYAKAGIIQSTTDWSILRPCDFSQDMETVKFCLGCGLGDQIIVDKTAGNRTIEKSASETSMESLE